MHVHPEVSDALAAGLPVVALESTIISHGLPRPDNLRVAREIEAAVRSGGAVPATIAIIDGEPHIGLGDAALRRVAESDAVVKVSVRDVAVLAARGGDGATTVASTAHLAAAVGISVFATGGLGGVHRNARDSWDESADLMTLSRTGVLVVCAGVKSILDVGATLERLESLNVGVIGYRTDRFPGFYLADSGHPVGWRVESPQQVADVLHARRRLGTDGYGRSDFRTALRRFFEVDRHYVAVAALKELADAGTVDRKLVTQAIKKYDIDTDAPLPTTI